MKITSINKTPFDLRESKLPPTHSEPLHEAIYSNETKITELNNVLNF